ncbi:hypothetical protein K474DRAFT_1656566 [Panus rudis PR-1116 ss-1]|nr:hypothetical protein K474DRAFT_1656566 [Panus rudis PR-1116 ss-1]
MSGGETATYAAYLSSSPAAYVESFDQTDTSQTRITLRERRNTRARPPPPPVRQSQSADSEATYVPHDEEAEEPVPGEKKRMWITAEDGSQSTEARQACERRTLVLCFDGTGDQFDGDNSNVVQFLAMLQKNDTSKQLVYYQAGIGTYTDPLFSLPVTSSISLVLDQMLAWNLASHIKDGYTFLMQNYTDGDKICIFGFSRGAYTARALAGMLHKVGLLPLCNHQQLPFAYDMYVREDTEGLQLGLMFKRTFCRSVQVDFLGVWDTVASVGIIPHYLPFIHENTGIKYLRHALALDERRVKFHPQFCVEPKRKIQKQQLERMQENAAVNDTAHHDRPIPERHKTIQKAFEDEVNARHGLKQTDVLEVWFAGAHTDVGGGSVPNGTAHSLARIPLRWMIRQCFSCNTGIVFDAVQLQRAGLRVTMRADELDEKGNLKPVLAPLPPRIKIDPPRNLPLTHSSQGLKGQNSLFKVFLCLLLRFAFETLQHSFSFLRGLITNPKHNPRFNASDSTLRRLVGMNEPDNPNFHFHGLFDEDEADTLVKQPEDSEIREELEDAMSPYYDQLEARVTWHILEWIPQRVMKTEAIVHKLVGGYRWMWNRGKGRKIPRREMDEGLKIHRSVKTRLEASHRMGEPYVPQVRPAMRIFDSYGRKVKAEPRQLTHTEWNVDDPKQWEWVD